MQIIICTLKFKVDICYTYIMNDRVTHLNEIDEQDVLEGRFGAQKRGTWDIEKMIKLAKELRAAGIFSDEEECNHIHLQN